MKKLLLLVIFTLFITTAWAEELIVTETNVLSEEYKLKLPEESKGNEISNVFFLRNEKGEYQMEVIYKKGERKYISRIPIDPSKIQTAINNNTKEENSWEKDPDHGAIIYGTTFNTAAYAGFIASELKMDTTPTLTLVSAASLFGFVGSSELSNINFFKKRDYAIMSDTAAASALYAYYILEDGERHNLAISSAYYAGYWGGKYFADKMDLAQCSGAMGLRFYALSSVFIDSTFYNSQPQLRRTLNLVAGPITFFSGAVFARDNKVSTGNMALLDTYSDSLMLIVGSRFTDDQRQGNKFMALAGLAPYAFTKTIEDRIDFYENDNYVVKASELVGALGGFALNSMINTEGNIRTQQLLIGGSILATNFLAQATLENRTKITREKNKSEIESNLTINPSALIYPALKVDGGGQLFAYSF